MEGTLREVSTPDGQLETIECYSLRETAEALGRSLLTLRKWVDTGIFPAAQLVDTTYNYNQYSRGELDVVAPILDAHFTAHSQLQQNHTATREALSIVIDEYRENYL